MTAPASDGKDSASGRFRLTIPQMLWLVALCAVACGFVVRATQISRRQSPDQLAFSKDGRLLAASFERGGILVWDVSGQPPRRIGSSAFVEDEWLFRPAEWIEHFQFAGNETLAFVRNDSVGQRSRLVLWHVRGDRTPTVVRLPGYAYCVAFSSDGSLAAVLNAITGKVDIIEVETGLAVHSLATGTTFSGLAFSEDGEELLAVKPGRLEVFKVEDGANPRSMSIPASGLADISPDGRYVTVRRLAANDWSSTLELIRTDGAGESGIEIGRDAERWWFLRGANQLAVSSFSTVQTWDISTGKQVGSFELSGEDTYAVAVSPDGRTLAVAERDRISLWDMRSGEQIAVLWSRNAFLEGLLFSAGLFAWAVVWGLMRRRRPSADVPPPDEEAFTEIERPKKKPVTIQLTFARLVVLLVVGSVLMTLLAISIVAQFAGDERPPSLVMIALALLSAPILFIALVFALLFVKRQILRVHNAELQRATGIARFPGRTAQFGNISAYFFGAPTLEAHFGEDLATARRRLESLLGKVAEAPHVPAFCFATQDEFDAYMGRQAPLSAVYSPAWWGRQMILCERPGHGIADPRDLARTLFGYLLLWNHKGFRTPYWLTTVVNVYVARGDDTALVAEVHRRLAAQLEREGDIALLPHQLDDKRYVKLVKQRDQRDPFRQVLLYSDVCISLTNYLLGSGDRRRRFANFLQGLTRRGGEEEALRRDYGCGVEQLFQDWLAWFRAGVADGSLDTSNYEAPTECERRQIVEDVVPLLLNADADLESRCRAARNLAGGSLLGAEALIDVLEDGSDELRQDALWSLEAIAGRRLGEDPAAWRSWLKRVKEAAAEEGLEEPLEAELLDAAPVEGESLEESASSPATVTISPSDSPTSNTRPIVTPPKALSTCWNLMILGGFVAILLPSVLLFETGMTGWPLFYYGVAMGVFAVTRGVGRQTRWLRGVALSQVAGALACDPINPVLGVVELGLSRTKRAREYLATHK